MLYLCVDLRVVVRGCASIRDVISGKHFGVVGMFVASVVERVNTCPKATRPLPQEHPPRLASMLRAIQPGRALNSLNLMLAHSLGRSERRP